MELPCEVREPSGILLFGLPGSLSVQKIDFNIDLEFNVSLTFIYHCVDLP